MKNVKARIVQQREYFKNRKPSLSDIKILSLEIHNIHLEDILDLLAWSNFYRQKNDKEK